MLGTGGVVVVRGGGGGRGGWGGSGWVYTPHGLVLSDFVHRILLGTSLDSTPGCRGDLAEGPAMINRSHWRAVYYLHRNELSKRRQYTYLDTGGFT